MTATTSDTDDDFDEDEVQREAAEFAVRVYGDYLAFYRALVADLREAARILKVNDSQFVRRTYLRALFAFIDGALFAERTIILEFTKSEEGSPLPKKLTDVEYMLLQEVDYELEENGSVKIRGQKFHPFLKYTRFIFEVSAKFRCKNNSIDYSGSGWQAFRTAYEVRNRITHPKSSTDLLISDSEMNQLRTAKSWFVEAFKKNTLMK